MKFTYDADAKTFAKVEHVLVVASKTCFGPRARGAGALTRWLSPEAARLATALGEEATPGLLGGLASSRTAAGHRLTVAALHDTPSRHAAPSRAEAIRKVTAAAGLAAGAASAVLVVLDDADHTLAAVNAIGRALPTFTRKSG